MTRISNLNSFLYQCALILLITETFLPSHADLQAIKLHGESDPSSYDSIKDLILSYKLLQPSLTMTVDASKALGATSAMIDHSTDFGISLQGWSESVAATAPNLYMLPMFLTGMVPTYRLDSLGVNAPPVIFSGQILVGMFTGSITRWNHPLLIAANPLLSMPDQNITVLIEQGVNPRNWIIKNALNQFNKTAMSESDMNIDNEADYPTHLYSSSRLVESSVTGLVTAVIATDGTFALTYQSVASTLDVDMGSMLTKAGNIVTFSEDSLTFAAIEKAIVKTETRTTAHVLTDPDSESAWPLAFFSYVLVDTVASTSSCKARQLLVEFLLYVYTDSIAGSIMRSRDIVTVPELILKQAGVIDLLSNQVTCRGKQALPTQLTSERSIAVSESFLLTAKLFSSVYSDDASRSTKFVPQVSNDIVMVNQLVNSEVDVIVVTPTYVGTALWNDLVASGDYLILPMLGVAPTIFLNPQITADVNLKTVNNDFTLDVSATIGVLTGCINDYNDPAIIRLNPWLKPLLGNASAPMYKVMGCGGTIEQAPLANYFISFVAKIASQPGAFDMAMFPCLIAAAQAVSSLQDCSTTPGSRNVFTRRELSAPLLAKGMIGGTAYVVADADDQKIYPRFSNSVLEGVKQLTSPSSHDILSCAFDTFDPVTLSFDFSKSKRADCYAPSQQMVGVVRKRYYSTSTNSSSCARGVDALRFMRWFFTDPDVDLLTTPYNMAQIGSIPSVRAKYLEQLNAVLCDEDTLLITLPIIWKLDANVFRLGIACASIGIAVTLGLIGCVIYHIRHPVMRAASPLFMMISMFGVLLLFSAVIALVSPVTNASCYALCWTVMLGICFTFIPLLAKLYRIQKIFGGRKLSVVKISNNKLLVGVAVVTIFIITFVSLWQALSPLQPFDAIETSGTPARDKYYTQCGVKGDGKIFMIIAGVMLGLVVLCGALVAFRIRKVTGRFNESSQVALAIYNVLFAVGLVMAVLLVIDAQGDIFTGLLLFGLVWTSTFTGGVLVIPKLMHIKAMTDVGNGGQSVQLSTSNNFSFLSLDGLNTLPMIGSYIAALRKHLELVQEKQTTLKRLNPGKANSQGMLTPQTCSTIVRPSLKSPK